MSIICCKISEHEIEIAADSILVRGYTQDKGKDKYTKLSKIGELIIGGSGLCSESGLLHIYAKGNVPLAASEEAIIVYFNEFSEWKKAKTDNAKIENQYLLVLNKKVFYFYDFFCKEILKYEAIGAGMDYALAALYLGHSAQKAVKTACELSIYCEEPIQIIKVKR